MWYGVDVPFGDFLMPGAPNSPEYEEAFLATQQCQEREGDGKTGYLCELPVNHVGPHDCSEAFAAWFGIKYARNRL